MSDRSICVGVVLLSWNGPREHFIYMPAVFASVMHTFVLYHGIVTPTSLHGIVSPALFMKRAVQ